jgi:hypothetical protein
LDAIAMTPRTRRHFLDRPLARVLAGVVFLGCVAALAYLERARWWQVAERTDGPYERCFAERAGQIDQMLAEGLIQGAQAELFKTRAEAMCRAEAEGGAPALPAPQR